MSQSLFTILFVDSTGTFRAPLAAMLLRHELEKRGIEDVLILYGGIEAEPKNRISPRVADMVPSLVVNSTAPKTDAMIRDLVDQVHLILVMDREQTRWLWEHIPDRANRIRKLGRFAGNNSEPEVPSVTSGKDRDYQDVFHQIERSVLGILSRWDELRNRFFVRQKHDVAVGADHRGYTVKGNIIEYLESDGYKVIDCGVHSAVSADHPIYAIRVAEIVARQEVDRGILICGSGLGMSITANKVKGIRAAMCINPDHAALSRSHNNANVLCLAAECFPEEQEVEIVKTWMKTPFLGGKYQRRNNIIDFYEAGVRDPRLDDDSRATTVDPTDE